MCNATEYYWDNVSNFTRIKCLTITVSNKLQGEHVPLGPDLADMHQL